MATVTLKQLTATQAERIKEMNHMLTRIKEKAPDTITKSIMQSRFDALNKIWTEAREIHAAIVGRDEAEDDPYIKNNVFTQLQTTYEDTNDEFLNLYAKFNETDTASLTSGLSETSITREQQFAKLPKLDLPTFSGNYEDWESFCDLFTNLVHNLPKQICSDATKLRFLKLCLTGSAADLVKDVTTTNANYATTWLALRARYNNPRLIVNKHLTALMNLNPIKKESAKELRFFADEAQRIIRALSNLGMPVEYWDVFIVHLLASRLDPESRKLWESELSVKDRSNIALSNDADDNNTLDRFPKYSEFTEFIEKRTQTLSMITDEAKDNKRDTSSNSFKPKHTSRKIFCAQRATPYGQKCPLCTKSHSIYKCFKFRAKTPNERRNEVRRMQLCSNCLVKHNFNDCPSQGRCLTCNDKHHTLLHIASNQPNQGPSGNKKPKSNSTNDGKNKQINVHTAKVSMVKCTVLLATAKLTLIGPNNHHTQVRALLDQGAESSFISESIVQLLNLPKRPVEIELTGLGGSLAERARYITSIKLQSRLNSDFEIKTEALIMRQLTSNLPSSKVQDLELQQFANIELADPQFFIRERIDLILGADVYGRLLKPGIKRFDSCGLVAQNTELGWILSGSIQKSPSRRAGDSDPTQLLALHSVPRSEEQELSESLQRFWSVEEVPESIALKPEDEACERLFRETHFRDASGRYVVRLPLKSQTPSVAQASRRIALGALSNIHKRFERDPKLAIEYKNFMSTYENLGHMSRVPKEEVGNPYAWYLPHHPVVTSTPDKWKLRVVFDASRKTHENYCLNDFLLPGPALQRDLSLILLNWRLHRYVFTADIVKMFRQIRVSTEDQDLQRIVWSPDSLQEPVDFRLNTVTYGEKPAPYLAIRTLEQLSNDEREQYPLGAECIEEETYVDDTFSGSNDLQTALLKRDQLIGILESGGIELDKWAANHPQLIPNSSKNCDKGPKNLGDDSVKTLGIQWTPSSDEFNFNVVNFESAIKAVTKRSILSNISRLFDPLGWLAPVTVKGKILMQDLWILKSDWDVPLPLTIHEQWLEYCNSLSALPNLSINRWLSTSSEQTMEIHGFSDASTRAYAAAIYLRIRETDGSFKVSLLASKTKVAPVKTISIPNLELCGAVLLVKLICHITKSKFFKNLHINAWSDSQVVLNWINKHPRNWKTFVANRVSFIQTELPNAIWRHVSSKDNPADLASRGTKPIELIDSKLWWHGPEWLIAPNDQWPNEKHTVSSLHVKRTLAEPEILTRFSSLTRLIRVVAYCLRFKRIIENRRNSEKTKLPSFLTSKELIQARLNLIKLAQADAFASEIKLLSSNKRLPKRDKLNKLNPFIEKNTGIVRVGGRLLHSHLPHESKHPPILPRNSALSRLYVRYAHRVCLHGGPTLTNSTLMQEVWILGYKRLVKTELRICITCQRIKPQYTYQLMGNLPAPRANPARPFTISGLDYAGPINIRTTKGRGYRSYKGYIALFICFSTRAVHLEAVSDLTSKTFLAAFRRFSGRRGICKELYSDNASTFQGADKELQKMFNESSKFYKEACEYLSNDNTNWNFIPPNTPHYGGLWEAGIKSTKHHLKQIMGESTLTFEELTTLLVEIEACLNSRPISPLTNDIDDLNVLTPAHFLIGESSALVPSSEPATVPENRLSRYQLLQRMRNNFWKRWSSEYLQYLQEREKWRDEKENFAIGQLVLLQDDRYPPTKWPRGRVIDVHPGPDGLIRVVTVKTANNELRRHIARLSPLFIEESSKEKVGKEKVSK